jgi:hypothetical protein
VIKTTTIEHFAGLPTLARLYRITLQLYLTKTKMSIDEMGKEYEGLPCFAHGSL